MVDKDGTIGDLPELYKGFLRAKEVKLIEEVEEFLDRALPQFDEKTNKILYAQQSIHLDKRITQLKSQLRVLADRKWVARCREASAERDELKEEGYRAQNERDEMIYRNPKIRSAHDLYTRINELAEYLQSLEWKIKHAREILGIADA